MHVTQIQNSYTVKTDGYFRLSQLQGACPKTVPIHLSMLTSKVIIVSSLTHAHVHANLM